MENNYSDQQNMQCGGILAYLKAENLEAAPYHSEPDEPQKNIPGNPDINNDPTRLEPGINEPVKNDPTRIDNLPEIFDLK